MSLFERKKPALPDVFLDGEAVEHEQVNYNSVLDYLLALTDEDYTKFIKVADIYRDANAKAADILGTENIAVQSVGVPKTETPDSDEDEISSLLDDDLSAALHETPPQKGRSVNVTKN